MNILALYKVWYKCIFVWFIICILIISIFIGCILLFISLYYNDDLVVDNYYEKGKLINIYLEKENVAKRLKISANIFIESNKKLKILLFGNSNPEYLILNFISYKKKEKDQSIKLTRNKKNNVYNGNLFYPLNGRYVIELLGDEWRLITLIKVYKENIFKLQH